MRYSFSKKFACPAVTIPRQLYFLLKVDQNKNDISKLLGRLYQVEYAMEAISHAGMALGIMSKEGIVLAAEKKTTSKLLENVSREKIYKLNEYDEPVSPC